MKTKVLPSCTFKGIIFLAIVLIALITSCTKPDASATPVPPTTNDTNVVVTQPPPVDTTTYIRRLEEDYVQSNPTSARRNRDYSFYYDNNKRVTSVGIKNYGPVGFDTATCWLFYSGSSPKPYMIITPNNIVSSNVGPVYYDTTYFRYNSNNQLVADSGYEPFYVQSTKSYIKTPLKRYYNYQGTTKSTVDWYGFLNAEGPLGIFRRDSLEYAANFEIRKTKSQFNTYTFRPGYYAVGDGFTYSNYINPLSRLNISGTIVSLIYTGVNQEVLGNSYHKAISSQNILPYYLDFFSSKIPSYFYLGGYTPQGDIVAGEADAFDIRITPWAQRITYPSQISVGASTALEDRMVYRYYYY